MNMNRIEVFDFGDSAVSWTLAAIHDNHRLSFHRKPPFAPHLLTRQNEENKVTESKQTFTRLGVETSPSPRSSEIPISSHKS
jgi:hypothetical protein